MVPGAIKGWIIGGLGAISIAMVYGFLALETHKNGGPHIYAKLLFGDKIGFFVSWLYWCGAWVCNPIVISTSVNYLQQTVGPLPTIVRFLIEVSIILTFTLLNIRGIQKAGFIETILIFIKMIPLVLIPLIAIPSINLDNFNPDLCSIKPEMNTFSLLIATCTIAFWGFVGLEEGGSTANSVKNPNKSVPLAIILGTSIVALICLINTIATFGIISCDELVNIDAPLAAVLGRLLGGNYDKILGILTFIMCCGSLNAWVLFSGKFAQTSADENIFPKIFGKTNKNGAPYVSLIISAIGTILVIALLEFSDGVKEAYSKFLDMSIIMYVILYLVAIISYLTFIYKNKSKGYSITKFLITLFAFLFFTIMLINSNPKDFIAVILIIVTSLPIYFKVFLDKNN